MTIQYCCILRGKTILCSHQNKTEDFSSTLHSLIAKVNLATDSMKMINVNRYFYHFLFKEEGIMYVCVTDLDTPKDQPCIFLNEIRKKFSDRALTAGPGDLSKDFSQEMRKYEYVANSWHNVTTQAEVIHGNFQEIVQRQERSSGHSSQLRLRRRQVTANSNTEELEKIWKTPASTYIFKSKSVIKSNKPRTVIQNPISWDSSLIETQESPELFETLHKTFTISPEGDQASSQESPFDLDPLAYSTPVSVSEALDDSLGSVNWVIPRTLDNLLEIPKFHNFNGATAPMFKSNSSFFLKNLTRKTLNCYLSIKEQMLNGFHINFNAFAIEKEFVIYGEAQKRITIEFNPTKVGSYRGIAEVLAIDSSVKDNSRSYSLIISSIAEKPNIQVCPNKNNIDFGVLTWGNTIKKNIKIENLGLATVPVTLRIVQEKKSIGRFWFETEETNVNTEKTVFTTLLTGRQETRPLAYAVHICCRAVENGEVVIDKESAQLVIEMVNHQNVHNFTLHINLEMYQLYTDKKALLIKASEASVYKKLEIKNGGNVEMPIEIEFNPCVTWFCAFPTAALVKPKEKKAIKICYVPSKMPLNFTSSVISLDLITPVKRYSVKVTAKRITRISSVAEDVAGSVIGENQDRNPQPSLFLEEIQVEPPGTVASFEEPGPSGNRERSGLPENVASFEEPGPSGNRERSGLPENVASFEEPGPSGNRERSGLPENVASAEDPRQDVQMPQEKHQRKNLKKKKEMWSSEEEQRLIQLARRLGQKNIQQIHCALKTNRTVKSVFLKLKRLKNQL